MENLFINKFGFLKRICYSDIFYITRQSSKTQIILEDNCFETNISLNYLSEVLGSKFIRSHKSYIINIEKIDTLEKLNDNIYVVRFSKIVGEAYVTRSNMKFISDRYTVI